MAESPATTTDLSNRSLRPLTEQELAVGAVKLEDAFIHIVTALPSVEDRLDKQPPNPRFRALVVQVQCAAVMRFLNNPEGKYEEQGDDYSFRRDSALSTGEVYISDAELALLAEGDVTTGEAFTIRPAGIPQTRGQWTDTTTWEPLL